MMTMLQLDNNSAARPHENTGGRLTAAGDALWRSLVRVTTRLFSRIGLAVAAGRFSSSSGGIGPWQC